MRIYTYYKHESTSQSELLLRLSIALILILSHFRIQQLFQTEYRIVLILSIVLIFFNASLVKSLLNKYIIPLVLFGTILLLLYLLKQEKYLIMDMYLFSRAMIIFIFGFSLGGDDKASKTYIGIIAIGYALASIPDLMIFGSMINAESTRVDIVKTISSGANLEENTLMQAYVYNYPILSILFILVIGYYGPETQYKILLFLTQLILFFSVLYSSFTAPVAIMILGLVLTLYFEFKARGFQLSQNAKTSIFILLLLVVAIFILSGFQGGQGKYVASRLSGFYEIFFSTESRFLILDSITGGRLELMQHSIEGFLKNPFLGVSKNTNVVIGGHSSAIDSFASYGLFGGAAMWYLFFSWLYMAKKNIEYFADSKQDAVLYSILIVLSISYFANPYFLSANVDLFVFLVGGIVTKKYLLAKNGFEIYRAYKNSQI